MGGNHHLQRVYLPHNSLAWLTTFAACWAYKKVSLESFQLHYPHTFLYLTIQLFKMDMGMDVNWCLTCSKQTVSKLSPARLVADSNSSIPEIHTVQNSADRETSTSLRPMLKHIPLPPFPHAFNCPRTLDDSLLHDHLLHQSYHPSPLPLLVNHLYETEGRFPSLRLNYSTLLQSQDERARSFLLLPESLR